jgi:hypothetical protein
LWLVVGNGVMDSVNSTGPVLFDSDGALIVAYLENERLIHWGTPAFPCFADRA